MARIRSIHPGLFTDEAFMSASPHARLLIIGLWCEAWDDGVVEWKPLTFKARIFPADNVDMESLLGELVALRFLRRFAAKGRECAAIRNFTKYQRPRKPNSSGLLPQALVSYVAGNGGECGTGAEPEHDEGGDDPEPDPPSTIVSPAPVRNQSRTSSGKSPQMEDGGGRGEERRDIPPASQPMAARDRAAAAGPPTGPPWGTKANLDRVFAACHASLGERTPQDLVIGPIARLEADGYDLDREIVPALIDATTGRRTPIRTWRLLAEAAKERIDGDRARAGRPNAPPPPPDPEKARAGLLAKAKFWFRDLLEPGRHWPPQWTGRPGDADCDIPPEIIAEAEREVRRERKLPPGFVFPPRREAA